MSKFKCTERGVRRLVNKYRKRLDIEKKWKVEIEIYTSEDQDPSETKDDRGRIDSAVTNKTAVMTILEHNIENAAELEYVVAHEMTHLVLDRVWEAMMASFPAQFNKVASDLLEEAIDQIARALVKQ